MHVCDEWQRAAYIFDPRLPRFQRRSWGADVQPWRFLTVPSPSSRVRHFRESVSLCFSVVLAWTRVSAGSVAIVWRPSPTEELRQARGGITRGVGRHQDGSAVASAYKDDGHRLGGCRG